MKCVVTNGEHQLERITDMEVLRRINHLWIVLEAIGMMKANWVGLEGCL